MELVTTLDSHAFGVVVRGDLASFKQWWESHPISWQGRMSAVFDNPRRTESETAFVRSQWSPQIEATMQAELAFIRNCRLSLKWVVPAAPEDEDGTQYAGMRTWMFGFATQAEADIFEERFLPPTVA